VTNFGDLIHRFSTDQVGLNAAMTFDALGRTAIFARFKLLSACEPLTGKVLWQLTDEADGAVTGSAFSQDGQLMAITVASIPDFHIRVIDLGTGTERYIIQGLTAHSPGPIFPNSPTFSPDCQLLAFHSGDGDGRLFVCSAATGEHLWQAAMPPKGFVNNLTTAPAMWFSPDSTLLAYPNGSGIVVVDAKNGEAPHGGELEVTAPLGSLWRFTLDSRRIAWAQWTTGAAPTVTLTDIDTRLPVCTFSLLTGTLLAVPGGGVFSHDARRIAVVGRRSIGPGPAPNRGAVAVFDLELGDSEPEPLPTEFIGREPLFAPIGVDIADSTAVAFSPGHRYLLVGTPRNGGTYGVRITDTDTSETVWLRENPTAFPSLFSPDGKYFAAWGTGDGYQIFAAGDPPDPGSDPAFLSKLRSSTVFDHAVTNIGVVACVPPVGVAATLGGDDGAGPVDASVTIFRADPVPFPPEDDARPRNVPIRTLIVALACGGDDWFVAIGGGNGSLRVLNSAAPTWQALHDGAVNAVVVAPSGSLIATGTGNPVTTGTGVPARSVQVFDRTLAPGENLDHRRPLWSSVQHPEGVIHVAMSADERWVVTGCSDGGVRVFENSVDAEHTARRTIASFNRVRSIGFGGIQFFAVGLDQSAIVVDATLTDATAGSSDIVYAHPFPPIGVCLNSDASLLATRTGPGDATLRVWRVPDGTETPLFARDYHGAINGIAFNPVRPILAVALAKGGVAILNTDTGHDHIRLPFLKAVNDVQFSTDGTLLIAASDDVVNIYSAI
jgi:WD40 repeat protein